jgi:hypothetical protein
MNAVMMNSVMMRVNDMDLLKLRKFYNLLLRLKLESDQIKKYDDFWVYYGPSDKLIYDALDFY